MEPSPPNPGTHTLRRWRDAWPPLAYKVASAALAVYTITLMVAGWRVAARDTDPVTPPLKGLTWRAAESDKINTLDKGARVRVSSFHAHGRHHPVYLVDGRRRPATTTAKWVSAPEDRAPWVEVRLAAPRQIKRVELAHAGLREHGSYTMRRYTLTCLNTSSQVVATMAVEANTAPVARHQIDCPETITVRLEFDVEPLNTARGVVRLYEIALYDTDATRPPRRRP